MPANYPVLRVLSLALLILPAAGCQRISHQQGMLERESTHAHLSSHQLRVMVNEFVIYFADRIELRADEILAETSDPAIRKNALRWKINGIASCFEAASRPDPLGAYLDVWILNRQMNHFVDSPTGHESFGPWQSIASEECHALEQRLQFINHTLGGRLRLGEDFVAQFAADFPLKSLYFDREPIASRYIEEVQEPGQELFHVVANLNENVDDLKKLSILYANHLPKQARWEAQLLLIDASQIPTIQRPLQDLALATQSIARVAHTVDVIPALVERERLALRGIVEEERLSTLRDVDRMRQDTLGQLEDERELILNTLREERSVVLGALHEERVAVSRNLDSQVERTLRATDDMTLRRVEQMAQRGNILVDRFFWRACQLLAVLGLLALAVYQILVRRSARQNRIKPSPTESETNDPGVIDFDSQQAKAA